MIDKNETITKMMIHQNKYDSITINCHPPKIESINLQMQCNANQRVFFMVYD